jgi:hypothetical protein
MKEVVMKKQNKLMSYMMTALGTISLLWFVGNYFIFELLRAKMIQFQPVSPFEEGLIDYVGVGWLIMTVFLVFSFFRIVIYLRKKATISKYYLMLLTGTALSIFFIFADLALISDIGKQYKHGLSQPEWSILYIITMFQFFTGLILTFTHAFLFRKKGEEEFIAKDSTVFVLAQYIGAVTGLLGLFFTLVNFLFPRPLWMIKYHAAATAFSLLVPYALITSYWMLVKIKEKTKDFYDEKQIQDMGISALTTLVSSTVIMGLLFFIKFDEISGILSVLWLPLYAFLALFLFSSINLYRGRDALN